MTPAVNALKKQKIDYKLHEYIHEESSQSYGLEAAEKLAVADDRVFKTLVVSTANNELVVGIVPVESKLSMKNIAKVAGAKKAVMAEPNKVESATGYVLGGVSPLGLKKRLKTFIDSSANAHDTIFISGGRRGLEIELSPDDLAKNLAAKFAEICQ